MHLSWLSSVSATPSQSPSCRFLAAPSLISVCANSTSNLNTHLRSQLLRSPACQQPLGCISQPEPQLLYPTPSSTRPPNPPSPSPMETSDSNHPRQPAPPPRLPLLHLLLWPSSLQQEPPVPPFFQNRNLGVISLLHVQQVVKSCHLPLLTLLKAVPFFLPTATILDNCGKAKEFPRIKF